MPLLVVRYMLRKKLGIEAIERVRFLENYFKIPSTLIIPKGVKGIRESTFYGCEKLKKVEIPESVKNIGGSAFQGCKNLREVIIPRSVKSIRWYAFEGCIKLKRVVILEGVKEISMNTFANCLNLEEVVIPESVERIGSYAFEDCKSATIILQKPRNKFEYFGTCAFRGCKDVKEKTGD